MTDAHNASLDKGEFSHGRRAKKYRHSIASASDAVNAICEMNNMILLALSGVSMMRRDLGFDQGAEVEALIAGIKATLNSAVTMAERNVLPTQVSANASDDVNVATCLAELGSLTQHLWNSRTRFEVWTSSDALAVTCNRLLLKNALLKLVMNAHAAMPSGGLVALFASKAPNGCYGEDVNIRVVDSGRGMAPEMPDRKFSSYSDPKPDQPDAMELESVERFAQAYGGQLYIQREPGLGTCVRLRLPAAIAVSASRFASLRTGPRTAGPLDGN